MNHIIIIIKSRQATRLALLDLIRRRQRYFHDGERL